MPDFVGAPKPITVLQAISTGRSASWAAAIRPNTRAFFGETIANPQGDVFDIPGVSAVAHQHGIPLIVDNTIATPYLIRPFEHGADIVVHSATKYLGGHGTAIAGLIIDGGTFDWTQGRHPGFTTPDESYHGVVYADLGAPAYLLNATLLGIMAQRLVRILCPHCKEAHPPTPEEEAIWEHLVIPWQAPCPPRVYRAVGCVECRMTGYMGRIGLYEILLMSPDVKKTVSGEIDLARVRDLAMREGMKPLRLSGALKVAAGITTLAEVVKVAPPVEHEEQQKPR